MDFVIYNVYSEKLNDRILFSLYMYATVEPKRDSDALIDLFLRPQL